MSNQDQKKKIVGFVKQSKPRSINHKVNSQDDFLDGVVSQVEYTENEDSSTLWVIMTNKYTNHADNQSQLVQQMNAASKEHSPKFSWAKQIFNIGGLLALILVGTTSYLALTSPETDIPEFLKAALLTVVGFYFGGYLSQGMSKKDSDFG